MSMPPPSTATPSSKPPTSPLMILAFLRCQPNWRLDAAVRVQDEACTAVCDFERETLAIRPTTKAGAFDLLRFVANLVTQGG